MTRTTKQVLDQEYIAYFDAPSPGQRVELCETKGCWAYPRYFLKITGKGYCPGCATIRASEVADAPREDTVGDSDTFWEPDSGSKTHG